jgi:hypothetical protein
MEHPFDPALKTLAELSPGDWLTLIQRRRRRITIEDTDIGTVVSGATDKLFRVHDDPEYLLHLDFETGHFRSNLLLRLRLYNSVFEYRHRRLVVSVPVLLSRAADSPQWNGLLDLFEEVLGMEESATYQAIVRRGRAEEARRILLLQGELKFGAPDAPTRGGIEAINDLSRLEDLTARLLSAHSWEELLARKGQRRHNGRRTNRE